MSQEITEKLTTLDADNKLSILTKDTAISKITGDDAKDKKNWNIINWLESINYTNTNQGSLWFKYNDKFNGDSIYFYSPNEITYDSLFTLDDNDTKETSDDVYTTNKRDFTNETTFNKTGYYLVLINVKTEVNIDYWQAFAFKYSTNTIDINVNTVKENESDESVVVGAGKYTNKAVEVSWKNPDVFERSVGAYYYTTTDTSLTIHDIMAQNRSTTIQNNPITLGTEEEVSAGEYLKYLVVLESEGGSRTYRIFTIDRQDISGIEAIAVTKQNTRNGYYYKAMPYGNGNMIISNGITDSLATLSWSNKPSGADIYAEYTFTPFVRNDNPITDSILYGREEWYPTKYELGTTMESFDFSRPQSMDDINYYTSIIDDQGIYIFTLTDDAGNSCRYMVIIDKTESYFKIGEDYRTGESMISSTNVTMEVGTHKAFELYAEDGNNSNDTMVEKIIKNLTNNANNDINYYRGNGSNFDALRRLFRYEPNKKSYYFTVSNTSLNVYDIDNKFIESVDIGANFSYTMQMGDTNGYTSLINKFYILGENNKYSGVTKQANNSKSYMQIEINTDNSRGMVFASDNQWNNTIDPDQYNDYRIYTGSDAVADEDRPNGEGLRVANATSAKYVMFTWLMGTGIFEIGEVNYQYYELDKDKAFASGDYFYFYNAVGNPVIVYDGSMHAINGGVLSSDASRGMVKINNDSETIEGLYVVTRTYKADDASFVSSADKRVRNYYFVVDRNGIYDITDESRNNIYINVLGNETDTNEFNGAIDSEQLEDNGVYYDYKIYLTTSKVPLTLDVPLAKYMMQLGDPIKNYNSTGYKAGRLNYTLYFFDEFNQLGKKSDQIKLCSGDIEEFDADGYATIDISGVNEKFLSNEREKSWLALPGIYVLVITDNVGDENKQTNSFGIGFEISKPTENDAPRAEILSGYSEESTSTIFVDSNVTTIYTSDEFITVKLPNYIEGEKFNPQLDPGYFVVKRDGKEYLRYEYKREESYFNGTILEDKHLQSGEGNGLSLNGKTVIKTTESGDRYIYLDTLLKKEDGTFNLEPTTYTITIRYRLSEDGKSDKYRDAYYYYASYEAEERSRYYETTYTIVIDRVAPKSNVDKLIANDGIVNYYDSDQDVSDFFVSGAYGGTKSKAYYTYQYNEYYKTVASGNTDKSKIYAFRITGATEFVVEEDLRYVKYRKYSPSSSLLGLPIVSLSNYDNQYVTNVNQIKTYRDILSTGKSNEISVGYYEILEIDKAGNVTQYVVYYDYISRTEAENVDSISISLEVTSPTDGVSITIGNRIRLDDNQFTVYSLAGSGASLSGNAQYAEYNRFYYIGISSAEKNMFITTDFTTNISTLDDLLAQMITEAGYGEYTIVIRDSYSESSEFIITYYDSVTAHKLSIKNLVSELGGKYFIDLSKAIEFVENIPYYATEITVIEATTESKYKYVLDHDTKERYYVDSNGKRVNTIACLENTTYQIIMIDALGESYYHIFNTDGSTNYDWIEGDKLYKSEDGKYYSFGDVKIYYNKDLYKEEDISFIGNIKHVIETEIVADKEYGVIKFSADIDSGATYNVEVQVRTKDSSGKQATGAIYNVTIDTNVGYVALKDHASGLGQEMVVNYYDDELDDGVVSQSIKGIMNLSWTRLENDYFSYRYFLHEKMKDGSTKIIEYTNGEISTPINTATDSQGLYKFEIRVYAKNEYESYLGNKVFTFDVQTESDKLYKVTYANGEEMFANAKFLFSDLSGYTLVDYPTMSSVKYPLFITNTDVNPTKVGDDVKISSKVLEEDILTLYTVDAGAYKQYFLILKVNDLDGEVVSDMVLTTGENSQPITSESYTLDAVGAIGQTVSLSGRINKSLTLEDNSKIAKILAKNTLLVDVSYNGIKVDTRAVNTTSEEFELIINGNGEYSFRIYDLAGNVQDFKNEEYLQVYVMREIAVTLNHQTPVNNAYFNGDVELRISSSSKYKTGSIEVTATKDGLPYDITTVSPYVFSGYGYFVVNVKAVYSDGLNDVELSKTVRFVILNENEARTSIDLTNLSAYKILKVVDGNGNDHTDLFTREIANPNLDTGMLVSYDRLIADFSAEDKLNLSSGKLSFTITYIAEDKYNMYPASEITFTFTLNNETPSIDCSLGYGESTNDGFNITFSESAIYEQIGDAYIYINNEIVGEINKDSATGKTKIYRSFNSDGAGDYYIKLVSSSGVILSSYKVTITEPLNTWAIILIVVVVGVVIAVVVVIIVLRHKMKIR